MSTPEGFQLFMPMSYEQYRSTSLWRAVRAAALLRAGNRCALDARHTEGLDVLHSTRERLGAEHDCDLVVLCASCQRLVRGAVSDREPESTPHPVPVRVPVGRAAGAEDEPLVASPSGVRWRTRRNRRA